MTWMHESWSGTWAQGFKCASVDHNAHVDSVVTFVSVVDRLLAAMSSYEDVPSPTGKHVALAKTQPHAFVSSGRDNWLRSFADSRPNRRTVGASVGRASAVRPHVLRSVESRPYRRSGEFSGIGDDDWRGGRPRAGARSRIVPPRALGACTASSLRLRSRL